MAKKWYAVYTKPNWEKKVAELLFKKNIENYCPLNSTVRQWADRRKTVLIPLFTSYVFVHIEERDFLAVNQTSGVINFVYFLNKPAVIKDEEIETIEKFLLQYKNVSIEKTKVSLQDTIRIIRGPLMEYEGKVIGIFNRRIKVSLPSLGYMLIAEVAEENVQII